MRVATHVCAHYASLLLLGFRAYLSIATLGEGVFSDPGQTFLDYLPAQVYNSDPRQPLTWTLESVGLFFARFSGKESPDVRSILMQSLSDAEQRLRRTMIHS